MNLDNLENILFESLKYKIENETTKKRLNNIFRKMKERCYNKSCKDYKDYGARGITIHKAWLDDVEKFYNWALNNGYDKNLTIDRKDADKGYTPSNCRWVDKHTQSTNRRVFSNNKSGYKGVRLKSGKWISEINIKGDKIYLGSFDNPEQAVKERNKYIKKHHLENDYEIQTIKENSSIDEIKELFIESLLLDVED